MVPLSSNPALKPLSFVSLHRVKSSSCGAEGHTSPSSLARVTLSPMQIASRAVRKDRAILECPDHELGARLLSPPTINPQEWHPQVPLRGLTLG